MPFATEKTVGPEEIPAPESTVLLARQPIFDRNQKIWGYELLHRANGGDSCPSDDCGSRATARVIVNALLNVGIDSLVGQAFACINVDREMLLGDYLQAVPCKQVVLEILETVTFDSAVTAATSIRRSPPPKQG